MHGPDEKVGQNFFARATAAAIKSKCARRRESRLPRQSFTAERIFGKQRVDLVYRLDSAAENSE